MRSRIQASTASGPGGWASGRTRAGGLPHGVGECGQVVIGRWGRLELGHQTDNLPATRNGKAPGMQFTQIVAMWLCGR